MTPVVTFFVRDNLVSVGAQKRPWPWKGGLGTNDVGIRLIGITGGDPPNKPISFVYFVCGLFESQKSMGVVINGSVIGLALVVNDPVHTAEHLNQTQ